MVARNNFGSGLEDASAWLRLGLGYAEYSIQSMRCVSAALDVLGRIDFDEHIVGPLSVENIPAITALKLIMNGADARRVTHDQVDAMLSKVEEILDRSMTSQRP